MTEAEVTKDIIDYLTDRGWRPVRMNVGGRRRMRFGEKGMCDWMVLDYSECVSWDGDTGMAPSKFWLELKAPGKPLRKGQPEWIKAEEEKGALVCVADSLESFQAWYEGVYG